LSGRWSFVFSTFFNFWASNRFSWYHTRVFFWKFPKTFLHFISSFFVAILFFSRHHFTTRRGYFAKDASCHALGLMCLGENDGGHVLGRGCLVKSDDDRVLLSWVPTPSHRVSVGLMTASERPPAKYLVGPLVVRF
jgi:hypothetical protein